jgi:hypothetical protein
MANIAAQRIKREFKEVLKSEEVIPELTLWTHTVLGFETFCLPGQERYKQIIVSFIYGSMQ